MTAKIYAAVATDGLMKVGRSTNPERRVSALRRRGRLQVVYSSPEYTASIKMERLVHRILELDGSHVTGEWFSASLVDIELAVARAERICSGMEPDPGGRTCRRVLSPEFSATEVRDDESTIPLRLPIDFVAEIDKLVSVGMFRSRNAAMLQLINRGLLTLKAEETR